METNVKIASRTVLEEFRALEVGESVLFPVKDYPGVTYIRNAKSSSGLLKDRFEGKDWTTKIDNENKGILVTRTA